MAEESISSIVGASLSVINDVSDCIIPTAINPTVDHLQDWCSEDEDEPPAKIICSDTTPCPVPNAHHNIEAVLTPGCLPIPCPVPYVRHNKENIPTVLAPQRLPTPCPVPCAFSPSLTRAIANKQLIGNKKLTLLREACEFYYGICPYPTSTEYEAIAKTLCDKFPELKK